jgi:hypothetical protein
MHAGRHKCARGSSFGIGGGDASADIDAGATIWIVFDA